jgi:multiple sugar transport system permease protein
MVSKTSDTARKWTRSTHRKFAFGLGPRMTLTVFIAPFLILFVIFRVVPTVWGMYLSFTKYRITGVTQWVGLQNFERLIGDPTFWTSLRVTLTYCAISVPATVVISILMAALCNRSMRAIKVYRFLYFLPVLTSFVSVGLIWSWIYADDGAINSILTLLGIPSIPFLSSDSAVLPSLSAVAVWTRFGYDMLILLAAMLAVPSEILEAAELDGAGAIRRFLLVTMPSIRPAIFFVVILELVQSFQVFDLIYVMTGGGPGQASYALTYFLYDSAFRSFDFGYASAIGVALFIITLAVTLIQRRFFKEEV